MSKSKIFYIGLIFLIIQLFVLVGVSIWIIPNHEIIGSNENEHYILEKYLGKQEVIYNTGLQKPDLNLINLNDVTDTNVRNIINSIKDVNDSLDYNIYYKLNYQSDDDFVNNQYGASEIGNYIFRYVLKSNDSVYYDVTFRIKPLESTINVAYINTNSAGNLYTTVEEALDVAKSGDVVYIIPGTNPIIYSNVEIKNGVKLNIPYEEGASNDETAQVPSNGLVLYDGTTLIANEYVDLDDDPNTLTIATGVEVVNNGELIIGGKLAAGPNGIRCGHTSQEYSILIMKPYSKLISNNKITCFGFIIEACDNNQCQNLPYKNNECDKCLNNNSELVIENGELLIPLIVKDIGDGSVLSAFKSAMNNYPVAPFNIFTFENITVKTKICHLASVSVMFSIYSPSMGKSAGGKSLILSPTQEVLVNLKENAYLVVKNNNKCVLYDFYGGASFNSFNISASALGISIDVNTSNAYLPVSYLFDISLNSIDNNQAIYESNQMLIFLPGSKIKINENVKFTTGSVIIHETYVDDSSLNGRKKYPTGKAIPKFEVSGQFISSNFGGTIYSTSKNSFVDITSSNMLVAYEAQTISGANIFASIGSWQTTDVYLKMPNVYSTNTESLKISDKGQYLSSNRTLIVDGIKYYAWEKVNSAVSCTITYSNSFNNNIPSESFIKTSQGYKLQSKDLPILSKNHYEFIGWFDELNKQYYVDDIIYDSITLIAKWIPITYNIDYIIDTDVGIIPNVTNNNPTTFNVDTLPTLLELIDTNYVMNGWFLNSDYSGTKLSKLTLDNLEYLNENVITLYTKWMEPVLKTYNVTLIVTDNSGNPINTITINDLTDEKTDIAYLNPYDGYGLSYTANDINDNSIKKYLDNWYFADYSSGEPQFTYNDSFKCGLSDKSEIILDGDVSGYKGTRDGENYIIYVKELSKYTVTYGEEEEYYVSEFTTRDDEDTIDTKDYIYRWEDSSGELYLTNKKYGLDSDIKLSLVKFHLVEFYVTNAAPAVSSSNGNYILESESSIKRLNNITSVPNGKNIYVYEGKTITVTPNYTENSSRSCKFGNDEVTSSSITTKVTVTVSSKKSNICIVEGTLITMADGTKKKIEDLSVGDLILVLNHETGKLEASPLLFNAHAELQKDTYTIIKLKFSNGNVLEIAGSHTIFDYTLLQYIQLNTFNVDNYIGHQFVSNSSNSLITLIDYEIYEKECRIYSPASVYHLNFFANDILMMPAIPNEYNGWFNYFELNSDLTYNEYQMNKDIETYGLFTYEEFVEFIGFEISEDTFNAIPLKYFKVSLGKGLTTKEEIIYVLKFALNIDIIE